MKKALLLVVLLAVGAGGGYVYRGLQQGKDVAGEYRRREMSGEEVREGIRSADLMTRLDAVEQLEKLPATERKAALLDALGSSFAEVRLTAVTALARGFPTDGEVVDRLLETAGGDLDPDVRMEAHRALGASGDVRSLRLAVETVASADATLGERLAAAEALDRVTGRSTAGDFASRMTGAEEAADDLGMAWEEWLDEHGEDLSWDEGTKRFVERR
jgi:HEAT repeat protein